MRGLRRFRHRLSYANAVATVALFVALGGASYAALALPADSVGTRQLKDGAVVSAKVRDGSLLARDFAPRQLPKGARGPRGLTGARGLDGRAGRDGAAVSARPRFTGTVDTPADHSATAIPLTASSWTQGAAEIDFGPYGRITYTAPDSSSCGGTGGADMQVDINVDGNIFSVTNIASPRDGATHTRTFDPTGYLFEPGSAVPHTATATVATVCESGSFPAPFTVSKLAFDIVRAS